MRETLETALTWAMAGAAAAIAACLALAALYEVARPFVRRLAALWRRSPAKVALALAALAVGVSWGGSKGRVATITFPRTNPDYELLKDAGSHVESDNLQIRFTAHALLPDEADIQIWRREVASTNDADWVMLETRTLARWFANGYVHDDIDGYWYSRYINDIPATNWHWVVFTSWQPGAAVQTNGVLHATWLGTNADERVLGVPLRTGVYEDGARLAPPTKEEDE